MRVKLKDIFDLQMGKTPSRSNLEYWNTTDYKWISIADLTKTSKYIFETKEYLSKSAIKDSGIKVIPANTVVMSFKLSIGKTAITKEDMYSNEAIMAFKDKHVINIIPEYIFYLLKYKNWEECSNKAVMGKTLNKATLSEIEVEICSIEKQRQIVNILDKIMSAVDGRKQELQLLDELIKARFVEMFGDCTNMISLSELCLIITDGTHQSPKFQHDGIPFILVSNLSKNTVTYDTDKFISAETYKELYKRTPIEIGDILLSTVGSYGHPAVVVEDRKFLFQRHIAYLKPKSDILNSYYMHGALLSPGCQRQIEEKVKGIAQKTLNLSEIRKIRIPVPSLDLQKQYADFVHQVNKSKVTV
ncbi:restriction endonuclease subunit S [Holdemanella porci]|uniref:restriction endonuclease subunit S n=1 Tax=Holdemanella porci TaxID=2652276 RepID=UPI003AF12B2E